MPGEPVGRNQIVSSSGIAVAALVRGLGRRPDPVRHRPRRRPALIEDRIAAGAQHDLLVTLGGASVGDHDLVQAALKAQGFDMDFWQHRHAPGKAPDVRRQGSRPRARLAGQSGLDHGLRAPVPEARDGPHAGPARRPVATRPARLAVDVKANDLREDYVRVQADADGRRQPDRRAPPRAGQLHAVGRWPGPPRCWCGRRTTPPRKAGDTVQVIDLSVLPGGY